jgi:hypothetical protein
MEFDSSNRLTYWNDSVNANSAFTVTTAMGWVLVAASKAAGSATPRFHKYRYDTNAWTHEDGSGAIADATLPGAGGSVFHGSADTTLSFFTGDILVNALFNRILTDAEVELLPFTLMHFHSLSPRGLWVFDQSLTTQSVLDWTGGGANQTAITGTALATNHPPLFSRYHFTRDATVVRGVSGRMLLLGVGR